jgi:Winged helix DNA-binding domain
VLTQRALNRALLSRQLLLDRVDLPDEACAARSAGSWPGAELFDLPSAPRPGEGATAPVRLAAEFDNLLLAHADRSRVVHPDHLKRFYTINGVFPGSVLIDGFVAGMWRLARTKSTATLTVELFGPRREQDLVAQEAARMLAFCAPGTSHDIRFGPAT